MGKLLMRGKGLMNTPAHVSGLSGPSGPHAAQPVELEQSRGPGRLTLQQSMTEQTALGTVLRPAHATLIHAQLTANGASGVNGPNAMRFAALGRKVRCEHMQSLNSLVEKNVEEMHNRQLSATLWMTRNKLLLSKLQKS